MKTLCFEGINGVGKTTQSRLLAARLRKKFPDCNVHLLQDPGVHDKHPANQHIRPLARFADWESEMTRMMLYMAARCELIAVVKKLRERNDFVILDRFAAGFYSYGEEAFREASSLEILREKHDDFSWRDNVTTLLRICNSFVPDYTVMLFMAPQLAMQRWRGVSGAHPDYYEKQGLPRLERLESGYRAMLDEPDAFPYVGKQLIVPPVILDPELTAEAIHESIWKELVHYLKPSESAE